MTHQFFLTKRSFYVLLADGRRENANFPYWLKVINLLGCEPRQTKPVPVLVLLNEHAGQPFRMPYDLEAAKIGFPKLNILERKVNFAQRDDRLEGLPRIIQTVLCRELSHLPLKIPAYWNAVRRELYTLRSEKNYIDFAELKAICAKHGISETDETQIGDLSQLLHDLGVILHFQELSLRDFIVLNPEWAVNAVYEVLRHKEVEEKQGRFDQEMLQRVWGACHFTWIEQHHLLNLMLKDGLEVCFRSKENNREIYIAPQLLPQVRPVFPWPPAGPLLRYTFQYPFMPKGIIGRLIVRLNERLETQEGKKLVWEKGMLLDGKDGYRALVEETEDLKTGLKIIKIEVNGPIVEERRYVLRDITQALSSIHQDSFTNLEFEQKIPCCCSQCLTSAEPHFFDFSTLKRRKKPSIECTKSEEDVLVQELFDGVFPDGYRPPRETDDLEALDQLKNLVPERMKQQVMLLQGRLKDLERGQTMNMVDKPAQEKMNIRKSILDLYAEAKTQK